MLKGELNKILGGRWLNKTWLKQICQKISRDPVLKGKNLNFSLAVLNATAIKKINRAYRGQNKPTNVLSFAAGEVKFIFGDRRQRFLGEILICWPVLKKEARLNQQTEKEYFKLLLVHGLVHLLGYDHEHSVGQARQMAMVEKRLLKRLVRI